MRWVALVALAACGAPSPRPEAIPRGVLIVRSSAASATLWVDEQPVGEVGRLPSGVSLPAGAHRVELRLDGYHTRYADVTLRPGETRVLPLDLVEELP